MRIVVLLFLNDLLLVMFFSELTLVSDHHLTKKVRLPGGIDQSFSNGNHMMIHKCVSHSRAYQNIDLKMISPVPSEVILSFPNWTLLQWSYCPKSKRTTGVSGKCEDGVHQV